MVSRPEEDMVSFMQLQMSASGFGQEIDYIQFYFEFNHYLNGVIQNDFRTLKTLL
jgi:hypothetical protein